MHMSSIEVEKEVYEYLEKLAAEQNLPVSEYINRMMRRFFITSAEAKSAKEAASLAAKEVRAIARNPERVAGKMSELEREVTRIYRNKEKQTMVRYVKEVHEYWAPFNYPNVVLEVGREGSGAEVNNDGVELDIPPFGAITITEEDPIVAVDIIGSACVSPGVVILHAEPLEWKYGRTGVKMKVKDLWGEHLLWDVWRVGVDEWFREAGMSSAHFEVPPSHKVTIMGHSAMEVDWNPDPIKHPQNPKVSLGHYWNDPHYCVRIVRVTIGKPVE